MHLWQKLALLIVAGIHLAFLGANVFKTHLRRHGWVTRGIAEYEALSGNDSFQTFFDGGATPALRPIFEVTDESGGVITDVLARAVNPEVDLRVDGLVSCFWCDDEHVRRALAGSWAGAMFDRHPRAEQVVVRVEVCEVPSMEEYRRGSRPRWNLLHRSMFSRSSTLTAPGATEAGR